jgi:hypothetical protein
MSAITVPSAASPLCWLKNKHKSRLYQGGFLYFYFCFKIAQKTLYFPGKFGIFCSRKMYPAVVKYGSVNTKK